jgi:prepilin-type N-terminal cleavage/methylation domain-containing protein
MIGKYDQKGLSLIEVLAALLLLSLLAVSIPAIFGPAATWVYKARTETAAVNYAASLLEELRSEPEKIDELNTGKTAEEVSLLTESPYPGMISQITRMQPQQTMPNLYDVMVTITWSQGGQPYNLQLSTVIRKEQR